MGNWKSEENINYFLENSNRELAEDFISRGYDIYVDGFTPQPTFIVSYLEEDKNQSGRLKNWLIKDINLTCLIFEYENYANMLSKLNDLGKDNYLFLFAIMPFQIRLATLSTDYRLMGVDRKMRIREQKLNQLLNE